MYVYYSIISKNKVNKKTVLFQLTGIVGMIKKQNSPVNWTNKI